MAIIVGAKINKIVYKKAVKILSLRASFLPSLSPSLSVAVIILSGVEAG